MEKITSSIIFKTTIIIFSLVYSGNIFAQEKKLKSVEVYAISYTMNRESGDIKSLLDVIDEAKRDSSFQILTDTATLSYLYKSKILNVKPKRLKDNYGSDRVFILYNYMDSTFERFILTAFIKDVTIVPESSIGTNKQIYSYRLKDDYWKDLVKCITNKKLQLELKGYMKGQGIK